MAAPQKIFVKGEKADPGSSDPVDPFGSCRFFWILWILLDPIDPSGSFRILLDPFGSYGSSWILLDPNRSCQILVNIFLILLRPHLLLKSPTGP